MTLRYSLMSAEEARAIPYPYVHVEADGSARELHAEERRFLEEPFNPMDGGRPYVKDRYDSLDGWGSVAGFCRRDRLPAGLAVAPPPTEDPSQRLTRAEFIAWLKDTSPGCEVVEGPDGTITVRRT